MYLNLLISFFYILKTEQQLNLEINQSNDKSSNMVHYYNYKEKLVFWCQNINAVEIKKMSKL